MLTHAPVLERLVGGADLMVPGLVGPFPAGAMTGRLVGIADVERPSVPIVVGVCEIDVARLARTVGEKGRAVRVLHWVGDEVYKHGSGGGGEVPQAIGAAEDVEVEKVTEKVQKLEVSEKDGSSGEEEVRPLETKEIDDAFYAAALYGFHDHAKSSKSVAIEFPLSSSAFISSLVHPYLPPASYFPPHNYLQNHGPHPSLQLKKSSWKNTAKFLKHLQGKKLVITKIRNGGETVITDIDWQHAEVLGFKPYKLPEAEKAPAAAASEPSSGKPSGMVKVEALFRPHGRNLKFFEAVSAG